MLRRVEVPEAKFLGFVGEVLFPGQTQNSISGLKFLERNIFSEKPRRDLAVASRRDADPAPMGGVDWPLTKLERASGTPR